MKGNPYIKIAGILFLMVSVLFPNFSQAQVQKVRVIVKNSTIRVKPNMQSKVIGSPPLKAVFEVVEKGDVWYKIKLNEEQYGYAEGYLNKMFIEEVKEEKEPSTGEGEEEKAAAAEEKEEKTKETEVKIDEEALSPEVPLSGQEAVGEEIRTLVKEYTMALQSNNLALFYEQNCISEFFPQVREDADWITRTYDRVNSCVSDVFITFDKGRGAEVSISLIITGLPRVGGSRKLLFEGTYKWSMEKQDSGWKIAGVASQPYK